MASPESENPFLSEPTEPSLLPPAATPPPEPAGAAAAVAVAIPQTVVLTIPSHSTGLGAFSWRMPPVPILRRCACCGGSERITPRDLPLKVAGYRGAPILVPYALCGACAGVAGVNRWIDRVIRALSLLAGAAFAWYRGEEDLLGLAIFFAPYVVVGLPARLLFRRKCPADRSRACDHAVSGSASESGSLGAFGKEVSSGAMRIQVRFADSGYAVALAEALRAEAERAPVIVELV